jgi:hypothetical protein
MCFSLSGVASPGGLGAFEDLSAAEHLKSTEMYGPRVIADRRAEQSPIVPRSGQCCPAVCTIGGFDAALCWAGRVAEDDFDLRCGRTRPRIRGRPSRIRP